MGKLSDIIEDGINKFVDFLNNQYLILLKEITWNLTQEEEEQINMKEVISEKLSIIFGDFPHDCYFYNQYMTDIIYEHDSSEDSNDQSIPIALIINLLPIASATYCSETDIQPIFKCNMTKTSYDSIIESMNNPFDRNDEIHKRILEHFITLFVGESLFIFLEKSTDSLTDMLADLLQDIFSYYSTKELKDDFTSLIPFVSDLFYKSQEIWSRNFGLLSRFHFEDCYKMLQKVLIEDLNNEEDSVTPNLKLNFYKHLCITPTRKQVSSHVLFLLNHFNHALSSKRLKSSTKYAVLEALKCLLANLTFMDMNIANSSSSLEDEKHEISDDMADSPIRCLWPSVKSIYDRCLKLTKISYLRFQATSVMITIIRKSPRNFFIDEHNGFLSKIRLNSFLEYKHTYIEGLKLVYEIIKGVEKYGDFSDLWHPKIFTEYAKEGITALEFKYSTRRYECYRCENSKGIICRILTPKDVFEMCFGGSNYSVQEKINIIKNNKNWKQIMNLYFKILFQICIEDLEYCCNQVIPTLMKYSKNFKAPDFMIVLKVSHKLLTPQSCFKKKYIELWGDSKVSYVLENLKHSIELEIINDIKRSTPCFSEFLTNFCSSLDQYQNYSQVPKLNILTKYKFDRIWK